MVKGKGNAKGCDCCAKKTNTRSKYGCRVCFKSHPLKQCDRFKALSPKERQRVAKFHKYCLNCFAHDHLVKQCPSKARCGHCHASHHTMLHFDLRQNLPLRSSYAARLPAPSLRSSSRLSARSSVRSKSSSNTNPRSNSRSNHSPSPHRPRERSLEQNVSAANGLASHIRLTESILLPTVLCTLRYGSDASMTLRCLLDTGSAYSVVYPEVVKQAGFETHTVDSISLCQLVLESIHDKDVKLQHFFRLKAFERITPAFSLPADCTGPYRNITLADADFFKSDDVDVIIGMDIYSKVVIPGHIGKSGQLQAINTIFGYAVSGRYMT